MQQVIARILDSYEHGRVGRRELIQTLAALAAGSGGAAGQTASTFRGLAINHTAVRVTNIARTRDFYQKHFGLPVIRQSEGSLFLGLGKNFLTFFRNATPGYDHQCIAIENFQPESVIERLKREGLQPRREADRIYFPDPDGLTVQVSALDHAA
jgi:catechol-2,3-dioxygenase